MARHLLNSVKAGSVYAYQDDNGSYGKMLQKVFLADKGIAHYGIKFFR
jgi:hypothetical protein